MKKTEYELWDHYLTMCECYKNELSPKEMGFIMIKFTSKMLYDCAPNRKEAEKVIEEGRKFGYAMHIVDIEA